MLPSKSNIKRAKLIAQKQSNETQPQNRRHRVEKIGDSNIYRNSVNVKLAKQGQGKTFSAMNEAIAASYIPTAHLILVVIKKAWDPSIESVKHLAQVPVVTLPYDQFLEYMRRLKFCKERYNEFHRLAEESNIPVRDIPQHVDNVQELYDILLVDDFTRPWLDTFVIIDDVGNDSIIKNDSGELNQDLRLCRDLNFTYWLCIHSLKQLTPAVRANTATFGIFKGMSHKQLESIFQQLNTTFTWDEFRDLYDTMNRDPKRRQLIVDNQDQDIYVE
jgi:hypothetical protein